MGMRGNAVRELQYAKLPNSEGPAIQSGDSR
jgi:hypothetical protein